jgi:hypothetical protein
MRDIEIMNALVGDYEGQRRREDQAFRDGFVAGWDDAYEVGYNTAHQEMAEEWAAIAAHVQQLGAPGSVPHDELVRRRLLPCGTLYEARLARHGREYQGGPVNWETGLPIRESA